MSSGRFTVSAGQSPTSVESIDYLAFTRGAIPGRVGGNATQLGAGHEQALRTIDESEAAFTVATGARNDTAAEFTYELPALTTFNRFAIPNIIESPNPAITFIGRVEVFGSVQGPDTGYALLAEGSLVAHTRRGDVTELALIDSRPIRWIRLRLTGGLDLSRGEAALEFTELIGQGMQEPTTPVYRFRGDWSAGAQAMVMRQQGAVVSGCFDTAGEFTGTVSGNVLHAIGLNKTDRTPSFFVLGAGLDGSLRGMRASGARPFRAYAATKAAPGSSPRCTPPPTVLACGAVLHLAFDADSPVLPPSAVPVIEAVAEGVRGESRTLIVESHTAAGDDPARTELAFRRAQAVGAELVRRGLAADRVKVTSLAAGRPLVGGADEFTRAFNRRWEVRCQ